MQGGPTLGIDTIFASTNVIPPNVRLGQSLVPGTISLTTLLTSPHIPSVYFDGVYCNAAVFSPQIRKFSNIHLGPDGRPKVDIIYPYWIPFIRPCDCERY